MAYLATWKRGAYQGAYNKDMKYHSNHGNQRQVARKFNVRDETDGMASDQRLTAQ